MTTDRGPGWPQVTLKRCSACREVRTRESFSHDRSRKDGLNTRCFDCDARKSRRYGWRKYGITDSVGVELRDRPCDLCGVAAGSMLRAHAIDHCHETGAVRGVLCHTCNTAIGVVESRMKGLDRLTHYLTRGADYRTVDRQAIDSVGTSQEPTQGELPL